MAKRTLTTQELEAQNAVELPNRDMMLVTVVVTNVLNDLTISIDVSNVQVGAQICAALLANAHVECEFEQTQ